MTLLPIGPQFGVKYTLVGPDGTIAVFNDDTDPNYIGMLTDVTGIDSPDVRENSDDLVEMDGGIHGDFFYGRRPVTLSGIMFGHASAAERNMRATRLMQATNAMRGDATLIWQADGGTQTQFVTLRRQQPLRITGGWTKEFQVSMVAADPRIYSVDLHSQVVSASESAGAEGMAFDLGFDLGFGQAAVSGKMLVENVGNHVTYPVLTVMGPGVNPTIINATTGQQIALKYTLNADESLIIDTLNRTVRLGSSQVYMDETWESAAHMNMQLTGMGGTWEGTSGRGIHASAADTTNTYRLNATFSGAGQSALAVGLNRPRVSSAQMLVELDLQVQAVTNAYVRPQLRWIDAYGDTISTDTDFPLYSTVGVNSLQQVVDVPQGADTVELQFWTNSTVGAGSINAYVGDIKLSEYGHTEGANRYSAVDFDNTDWWGILPGVNDLRLLYYSYSAGASLKVDWRDAWL